MGSKPNKSINRNRPIKPQENPTQGHAQNLTSERISPLKNAPESMETTHKNRTQNQSDMPFQDSMREQDFEGTLTDQIDGDENHFDQNHHHNHHFHHRYHHRRPYLTQSNDTPQHHHHHNNHQPLHHHHNHHYHHHHHQNQHHNLIDEGILAERTIVINRWRPDSPNEENVKSFYDEYIRVK